MSKILCNQPPQFCCFVPSSWPQRCYHHCACSIARSARGTPCVQRASVCVKCRCALVSRVSVGYSQPATRPLFIRKHPPAASGQWRKLKGQIQTAVHCNHITALWSWITWTIQRRWGRHRTSTDEKPQHQQCPDASSSSCFSKKATATGQQLPSHPRHVGTPISAGVTKAVKPIYSWMSDLNLLSRVLRGWAPNAQDCLNGQIWACCPKTAHVGASRITAAVASAVSHFNQGCSHTFHVMKKLGVTPAEELRLYQ